MQPLDRYRSSASGRKLWPRFVLASLILFGLSSCSETRTFSLSEPARVGELLTNEILLDSYTARPHLLEGWEVPVHSTNTALNCPTGKSSLRFYTTAPIPIQLSFRGWTDEETDLIVQLNEGSEQSFRLSPVPQVYEVKLDKSQVKSGSNTLLLQADSGTTWDWFKLTSLEVQPSTYYGFWAEEGTRFKVSGGPGTAEVKYPESQAKVYPLEGENNRQLWPNTFKPLVTRLLLSLPMVGCPRNSAFTRALTPTTSVNPCLPRR